MMMARLFDVFLNDLDILLRTYGLFGPRKVALLRPDGGVLISGRRCVLPRLADDVALGSRRSAQLFDAAAVALLDAGGIGAAPVARDDPRILLPVEPAALGAGHVIIFAGISGAELLVEPAEPRVAADHLFVRGGGVAAVETLGMRRRGGAYHSAGEKQGGQQRQPHWPELYCRHAGSTPEPMRFSPGRSDIAPSGGDMIAKR